MFKYLLVIFIQCLLSNIGEVNCQDILNDNLLGVMINELYSMYKDAYENEKTYVTRRFFTNHNHYTLHVEKLKEVNGWKTHNLKVESMAPWGKPVIYINNPVECHMPNAFLSREEFQRIMRSRIEQQKKRFSKDSMDLIEANKYFKTHTTLPTDVNVNVFQVLDKINSEIIDAIDSQIKPNTEATNTRTTDELTDVSNKNKPETILRKPSPYTYKNVVRKSSKITVPGHKITEEIKHTVKIKPSPRHKNIKSKTTKSNILIRSHLASKKIIKRNITTTTKPTSKFVTIPQENERVEEIRTNKITNSTKMAEKFIEPTIDVTTEPVLSSTKVIADKMIEETTTIEPEVIATKTETIKNTDKDATVPNTETIKEIVTNIITNSTRMAESVTEPTIEVTTEAVVSSIKVIADKMIEETTPREPEVIVIKTETIENTDKGATVPNTESPATVASTDTTTDVATETTVVSDTTATTTAKTKPTITQTTTKRTKQRRPYVFMGKHK